MGKTQKALTTTLWAALVVAMIGIVASQATRSRRGNEPRAMAADSVDRFEPLFDAPNFKLSDQDGKQVSSDDLRGSVYIADFIFTNCAGPCPVMTSKLVELEFKLTRGDVKLISFTVDPQRDTPEVLKEFAQRSGADESRWRFLTGTVEQMRDAAVGFKVAAKKEADESVTHSTQFLLINRKGQVCGIYRNGDEDVVKKLLADATELADRSAPATK